jgi:hypothetical protein
MATATSRLCLKQRRATPRSATTPAYVLRSLQTPPRLNSRYSKISRRFQPRLLSTLIHSRAASPLAVPRDHRLRAEALCPLVKTNKGSRSQTSTLRKHPDDTSSVRKVSIAAGATFMVKALATLGRQQMLPQQPRPDLPQL